MSSFLKSCDMRQNAGAASPDVLKLFGLGDPQSTGLAWSGSMQSRTLNSCLLLLETSDLPWDQANFKPRIESYTRLCYRLTTRFTRRRFCLTYPIAPRSLANKRSFCGKPSRIDVPLILGENPYLRRVGSVKPRAGCAKYLCIFGDRCTSLGAEEGLSCHPPPGNGPVANRGRETRG